MEYTNSEQKRKLHLIGQDLSLAMGKAYLRSHIQHADEHALIAPFAEDFVGYEEPPIEEILDLAQPYLPSGGALGEMVLSVGKPPIWPNTAPTASSTSAPSPA